MLNPEFDPLDTLKVTIEQVRFLDDLASNFMCSPECPCLGDDLESIKGWTSLTEIDVNEFDRTLSTAQDTILSKLEFKTSL